MSHYEIYNQALLTILVQVLAALQQVGLLALAGNGEGPGPPRILMRESVRQAITAETGSSKF